jgi:hypothetical protein
MGRGIDFMVCVGVVLLSYFVVGAVLLVSAFVRGRKRMRRPRLASGKES